MQLRGLEQLEGLDEVALNGAPVTTDTALQLLVWPWYVHTLPLFFKKKRKRVHTMGG